MGGLNLYYDDEDNKKAQDLGQFNPVQKVLTSIFGKKSKVAQLFSWFFQLLFGFGQVMTQMDESRKMEEKKRKAEEKINNPQLDLDEVDDPECKFIPFVSRLKDRGDLNRMIRLQGDCPEVWGAIEDALETNKQFPKLNELNAKREKELLKQPYMEFIAGDFQGLLTRLKRRLGSASPETTEDIYYARKDMIDAINNATVEAQNAINPLTRELETLHHNRDKATAELTRLEKEFERKKAAGEPVNQALLKQAEDRLANALSAVNGRGAALQAQIDRHLLNLQPGLDAARAGLMAQLNGIYEDCVGKIDRRAEEARRAAAPAPIVPGFDAAAKAAADARMARMAEELRIRGIPIPD